MNRGDALTLAVKAVDLPTLIGSHYPASKCVPGKAGVFFAAWRGNVDTPALSLSRKNGVWLWHDMATDSGGNAFDFLVDIAQMTRQEAANLLLREAGMGQDASAEGAPLSTLRPLASEAVESLAKMGSGRIPAMAGRGFNNHLLTTYGIVTDNGKDALIPITSPEGVVLQVKRRLAESGNAGKYRYEHKGFGGPPWCSNGSRQAPLLLIVEGELNAIIAHAALQEAGDTHIGVMGVAGAKNDIYPGLANGKTVYVYADNDKPGQEALLAWAEAAHADGAKSVHLCPAHDMDFCDYAGKYGRESLALTLQALMAAADQKYGALDRLLGGVSVRDFLNSADHYFDGGVIHSTGFKAIDKNTGGIRESGIYAVAGLPSLGKSALMRRFLIEHVRGGGIVKLYSPDQSPRAVYRLLASVLADVGVYEARTRQFLPPALERYGSPEAALKALKDTYEHVILEIAPRFQVTEEGDAAVILKDMERAVDQGVTMFGVDYLQVLEPAGRGDDGGQVAKDIQKLSHRLRAPVVAALQLAKYKFPPSRASGVPISTDIEGSGAYFQTAEMVFMIYNEGIYREKYANPDTFQPAGISDGEGLVLLTKDKEGDGNMRFYSSWVPRLITYRDVTKWDLDKERRGLM